MSTFTRFKDTVRQARHEAHVEARSVSPFIRSRGTWLCTAALNGDQCKPNVEAECPVWDGTKVEIEHLVDDVQARFPEVAEIYIAGGFDGADRLQGFDDGDYEPWVSAWKVTVWKRGTGVGRWIEAPQNRAAHV